MSRSELEGQEELEGVVNGLTADSWHCSRKRSCSAGSAPSSHSGHSKRTPRHASSADARSRVQPATGASQRAADVIAMLQVTFIV